MLAALNEAILWQHGGEDFCSVAYASLDIGDGAGRIDRAQGAQAALAQGAFFFELGLRFDGESRPGDGVQASFGDRFAGQLADAVGVFLDPLERLFDFVDGILIRGEQTERKVAVEIVRSGVGHVEAITGHFLGRLLGQAAHLVEQPLAEFQQGVVVFGPFGLDLHGAVARSATGGRDGVAQYGRRGGRPQLLASRFLGGLLLRCHSQSVSAFPGRTPCCLEGLAETNVIESA